MTDLYVSLPEDFEHVAYLEIIKGMEQYTSHAVGEHYIPRPALKAMGRRYLTLRDLPTLAPDHVLELARLYAFFACLYPNGYEVSLPAVTIDFLNFIYQRAPLPLRQ